MRVRITCCAVLLLGASACVSGPRARVASALDHDDVRSALLAYDRFRRDEEPDPALLALVAAHVLEREFVGSDPARRDAALTQLTLAGTAGAPVLLRLASRAPDELHRALALDVLASHRDEMAQSDLRELVTSNDPAVRTIALSALDRPGDVPMLLVNASANDPALRAAAASALGRFVVTDSDARRKLIELSRVDVDEQVRAHAVRAVARLGVAAADVLTGRLSDASLSVRLAAISGLSRAGAFGERALAPMLAMPPSQETLTAARALSTLRGPDSAEIAAAARVYLRAALSSDDATIRSQAALALGGFASDPSLESALLLALAAEHDPNARLQLAATLVGRPSAGPVAIAALTDLMNESNVRAVQAASILLHTRLSNEAVRRLLALVVFADAAVRRVAVRAVARDAMRPDDARRALLDADALVRIQAAGGILAAVARGS